MSTESKSKILINLPDEPGVYIFKNITGEIIYIGKAISLKKRVKSYFASKQLGPKTSKLVSEIAKIEYIKVFSEFEALLLEAELIRTNKPFYNIQARDDKSPIFIKITKDEIPLLETTRAVNIQKKDFFVGPFPSSLVTRDILKIIRSIFPYCHHNKPKKPCLYVHLGLCPYPKQNQLSGTKYLKTIAQIKKLLDGKNKSLIRDLTRQMNISAKKQQYEQANSLKNKIQQLDYLHTTYKMPREFLERPNLVDDLTKQKLEDIKNVLQLKKIPTRIECYDISNIGGKLAVGSMIVFTNGKADKSSYRKFKIKYSQKSDDYKMISEVIERRIKNNWPIPDLMIVDGGRGQLNAALSSLSMNKRNFNVIALSKKLEHIHTPAQTLPISLPKESPARQLIQALRDEAHRFAISYHRLLRSKKLLSN